MRELARSAMRHSESGREQVALVIGPPWLRTGTGRVIEDQIAYYRDRGYGTAFVGVPVGPEHRPENPMWRELADAASDLRADHVSFAILDAPQNPKTLRRRIRQAFAPRTSLDWIVEIGLCSRPSPALLDYLRDRSIAFYHVNHVFTLGFAGRLRRELRNFGGDLPLVLETHDIQSQILHDRNEPSPWTGHPDEVASLLSAEKTLLRQADVLIHCSVADHRFFSGLLPEIPQFLAFPTIGETFVAAVPQAQEIAPIDILLVGTGHHANSEAVEWFLTDVWPLIASRRYKVSIVGGVKDMLRQRRPDLYDQFNNFFLGRVSDLAPFYRSARSVIAPMRSGGGISIKTIEAFALGIPFIGTSKAYRGLPPEPLARHGIESHDHPRAFADALLRVLSGNDAAAGKRGRTFYQEIFSKETCYAVRDEATRMAYKIRARAGNPRDAAPAKRPFNEDGNARDIKVNMDVLVLGTSNCIGPASFVEKMGAAIGVKLTNLAVGACSSTLGLYQLDKIRPVRRGVAFIDFAITDPDVAWNLWGAKDAPQIIADTIRTIVARLRSMNFLPILILLGDGQDPLGSSLHRKICTTDGINFIDVRTHLDEAMRLGASRGSLLKDDCHISAGVAEEVARFLATVVRRMDETSVASVPQSSSILQGRVVHAGELFPPSALVDRGSSLRSGVYGRLAIGDSVDIPLAHNERLRGVMVNVGARGGTVAIGGGKAPVIKSMTTYWDAEHPEWFGSLLIDFAHPLPGGAGNLVMRMVDPDAVPTEPTIHSKPILMGRYGELEIEGVLLTSCDKMELNYSAPAYDWMPLDLGALAEARQLAEGLARLQCAGAFGSGSS